MKRKTMILVTVIAAVVITAAGVWAANEWFYTGQRGRELSQNGSEEPARLSV